MTARSAIAREVEVGSMMARGKSSTVLIARLKRQETFDKENTSMEKIGNVCSHSTSVVKAFTWRFIATSITTVLVFIMTPENAVISPMKLAASVGVLDVITKLIAYYFHERGWLKYGHRLEFLTVFYCKTRDRIAKLFGRRKP